MLAAFSNRTVVRDGVALHALGSGPPLLSPAAATLKACVAPSAGEAAEHFQVVLMDLRGTTATQTGPSPAASTALTTSEDGARCAGRDGGLTGTVRRAGPRRRVRGWLLLN
jgi:hypothetical protein